MSATTLARAGIHEARRARALALAERYGYAAEPLRLYAALAERQGPVYERARERPPTAHALAAYVVRESLPAVLEATMAAGTELLREAALLRFHEGDHEAIVAAWLAGDELGETDAFLARAACAPVLEAAPEAASSVAATDERRCPSCGSVPQLAVFTDSGEALVTGQRRLVCARCTTEWAYPRMTCVSCRETNGGAMPILADETRLPHMRADACDTCGAYLITVDMHKDPSAAPLVDEIAALPLDLLARERGYTKISRNVMGF